MQLNSYLTFNGQCEAAFKLAIEDPVDAERIFHALAESGTVKMPIQQTFWAARFGMLVDRFGIPWMVNCEQAAATIGGGVR